MLHSNPPIMNLHPKVLEIWGRQLWVIRWHKWEFKFSPEDLCDNFHLTGNKMCVSSNYRREYLFFTYIYFPCILHSWEFENIHGLWEGGERKREGERVLCFLFSTILTGTLVACGTKPTSPKCLRGYCTSYQKLACFVPYLKIIKIFLKNKLCIL